MGPLVLTLALLFVNAQDLNFLLQIRMLLRLIPVYGGDGTVCGIIAMNDTCRTSGTFKDISAG
jgi:hypothetical protein